MTKMLKPTNQNQITETDLKFLAYKRYQMDSLGKANIGIADIWETMRDIAAGRTALGMEGSNMSDEFNEIWQEMMYNTGIKGVKVLSYCDFLDQKYNDAIYMRGILSPEEYEAYCNFNNIPYMDDIQYFAATHTSSECLDVFSIHEAVRCLELPTTPQTIVNPDVEELSFKIADKYPNWIDDELLDSIANECKETDNEEEIA